MKRTITKHEALVLLGQAVAEKGKEYIDTKRDKVYFTRNGRPSCGVGQALAFAGVGYLHTDGANSTGVGELNELFQINDSPVVLDADAVEVLEKFRLAQDSGKTWDEAFDAALSVV